jgi:hypothetical protein
VGGISGGRFRERKARIAGGVDLAVEIEFSPPWSI